jgi:hypothetical protein
MIHRVPVRHRIRVRTTNLAQRSLEEERWRTKIIPRLGRALVPGVGQRHRAPPAQERVESGIDPPATRRQDRSDDDKRGARRSAA